MVGVNSGLRWCCGAGDISIYTARAEAVRRCLNTGSNILELYNHEFNKGIIVYQCKSNVR